MAWWSNSEEGEDCCCRRSRSSGGGTPNSSRLRRAPKPACRRTHGKKGRGCSNSKRKCLGRRTDAAFDTRVRDYESTRISWKKISRTLVPSCSSFSKAAECVQIHLVQRIDDDLA